MVGEPVLPGLAEVDHAPAVAWVEEVRRPLLGREGGRIRLSHGEEDEGQGQE